MIEATGSCAGIENYSRYLTGRRPGEPPPTFFEYIPDNALLFVDESHQTVPQIGGMYRGDYRRKSTLAEYGFRLPSCLDNRPLKFEEWEAMRPQTVAVSATPAGWELEQSGGVFVEQVIRPTGLIDPPVEVRPARTQVDDVIAECRASPQRGYRTLVTVLTKKMAEDLTEYMHEQGLRVRYMHSDIDTLERIEIIRDLRLGAFDVLVGINLLREGLDIPECGLVAILDADKEGFLRSETSLIQTIGRAARNVDGRVILYADTITGSMERAMAETNRRREKQDGLQHRERHHAGEHQEPDQGHPRQRLRARPVPVSTGGRRRFAEDAATSATTSRPPSRPGKPHARSRRRPRIRGSRAAARRDQAPARDRARRGRRPDREGRGVGGARGGRGSEPQRPAQAVARPDGPGRRGGAARQAGAALHARPPGHARRLQAAAGMIEPRLRASRGRH